MHIQEILAGPETKFSFEFFPPKTKESAEILFGCVSELQAHAPSFVSVTYGAGGSTRTATHDLVVRLKQETDLAPVPHLTCVGHTKREISEILERYALAGVSNILALRGDSPKIFTERKTGDFPYAADLVAYIRKFSNRHGHDFEALQRANGDDSCVRRTGIHYATEQCADLLDHRVTGIHFYTLNQATAVREIFLNLGIDCLAEPV